MEKRGAYSSAVRLLEARRSTGRMLLCVLFAAGLSPPLIAEARLGPASGDARARAAIFSAGAFKPLGFAEAASVRGGDVFMTLNRRRTSLRVEVSRDRGDGRSRDIDESYDLDVHNRVADTNTAPFFPAPGAFSKLGSVEGLTAKPQPFPAGTWLVTEVRPRDDKYGPYSIMTNAVGTVEVFRNAGDEGSLASVGMFQDQGYALHSNTLPFDRSLSYGCLVLKKEDIGRLADTLIEDRERDPASVQRLHVMGRRGR